MFIFLLSSSKDRIPFLMHDHQPGFLLRTTDVKERFPDNITSNSSEFTWEELQSLNAGDWFLKVRSAPSLTQPHKASMQLHIHKAVWPSRRILSVQCRSSRRRTRPWPGIKPYPLYCSSSASRSSTIFQSCLTSTAPTGRMTLRM